jgi:adenylate kinase family enzyme
MDVPVHHLDRHMFGLDGAKTEKQQFIERQKAILDTKAWIIEGCSFSTFEMRFCKAEAVVYLNFSPFVCFFRLFKRMFNYKKQFGGLRMINWNLINYTKNFDAHKKEPIEILRKNYPQTTFVTLKNEKEVDLFLKDLVLDRPFESVVK